MIGASSTICIYRPRLHAAGKHQVQEEYLRLRFHRCEAPDETGFVCCAVTSFLKSAGP
jgi:hypothetical protein